MSVIQATYKENIAALQVGQIVTSEPGNVVSRTAAVDIPFGAAVSKDSAGDRAVHVTTTGDTVVDGVAVINVAAKSTTGNKYTAGDEAAIIRRGAVAVAASTAVNAGDPVTVVAATGAFTTGGANIAVAAVWRTTLGAAGIGIIDINLP